MAEPLGEPHEILRRATVRGGREGEVRQRVTGEAVGTALQQDELGALRLEELERRPPSGIERGVVGTRRERRVVLRTGRCALARLQALPVPG